MSTSFFLLLTFFTVFVVLSAISLRYNFFRLRHTFLRIFIPKISLNIKKGIIQKSALNWCTLPLKLYDDGGNIPEGIMDITHPSIVYMQNSWNGYTHWLAATPYPQSLPTGGAKYENTCIFYANQSLENIHPQVFTSILKNPIILREDAQYNSDPDLFYDKTSNKIYCITRKRNGPDFITKIVIQHSEDGHNWSKPLTVITIDEKNEFLSPCLIKFKNKFRIYAFQTKPDNRAISTSIDIWESDSIVNPEFSYYKSINWSAPMNIWHGGLFSYDNKLYLIFCGAHNNYKYLTGHKDSSKYLFMGCSNDGENFNFYDNPVLKMNGVYRSSAFIDRNEQLVCYVSLHNRYHEEKQYASGHRIGMFVYPFKKLLIELSNKSNSIKI